MIDTPDHSNPVSPAKKPLRRWLRYSLRSLMLLVLLIGAPLDGWPSRRNGKKRPSPQFLPTAAA